MYYKKHETEKCVICQGYYHPSWLVPREQSGLWLTKPSGDNNTAPNVFVCEYDYAWLLKLEREEQS
jgi:hypothetical protein